MDNFTLITIQNVNAAVYLPAAWWRGASPAPGFLVATDPIMIGYGLARCLLSKSNLALERV